MQITSHYPKWIRCTLALAAGFLLLPVLPALRPEARQRHKPHPAQKHKPHPAQKHKVRRNVKSADQPVKRHYNHDYSHRRKTRHHHYRHHHYRARLRIQPGRVKEIQQALGRAGYLREGPTGRWDAATRDAMQRYQQDNGFKPTGLPEAKPLMKLGLGPHPLPPGLQPVITAKASPPAPDGEAEASASANTSSPARPSGAAQ